MIQPEDSPPLEQPRQAAESMPSPIEQAEARARALAEQIKRLQAERGYGGTTIHSVEIVVTKGYDPARVARMFRAEIDKLARKRVQGEQFVDAPARSAQAKFQEAIEEARAAIDKAASSLRNQDVPRVFGKPMTKGPTGGWHITIVAGQPGDLGIRGHIFSDVVGEICSRVEPSTLKAKSAPDVHAAARNIEAAIRDLRNKLIEACDG